MSGMTQAESPQAPHSMMLKGRQGIQGDQQGKAARKQDMDRAGRQCAGILHL